MNFVLLLLPTHNLVHTRTRLCIFNIILCNLIVHWMFYLRVKLFVCLPLDSDFVSLLLGSPHGWGFVILFSQISFVLFPSSFPSTSGFLIFKTSQWITRPKYLIVRVTTLTGGFWKPVLSFHFTRHRSICSCCGQRASSPAPHLKWCICSYSVPCLQLTSFLCDSAPYVEFQTGVSWYSGYFTVGPNPSNADHYATNYCFSQLHFYFTTAQLAHPQDLVFFIISMLYFTN